jgi:hypothetical protein
LQGAEVIRVAELNAQCFEDCPLPIAAFTAKLSPQVLVDISHDAIVIEQRVIYVEQEIRRRASLSGARLLRALSACW